MLKAYLPPFIVAALISGGLTYYVKSVAHRLKVYDLPTPRKIHEKPTPRLGGVAMVASFLILAIGYTLASQRLAFSPFKVWFFDKHFLGVLFGLLILLFVGILDDLRGVTAWKKLFWHLVAAIMAVIFGIGINYIRLPGGLHINLDSWIIPINLFNHSYAFVVWGDLITIFWIVLMINTLNFLDGLDGLAGGISLIAAIVIFFLSFSLGQYSSALLSLIFAGIIFGFMPWNFNPAKIFMGDSGSMFLGYMLGVLSVISGGKVATAFLVLGIPVLDVGWVALRRIFSGQSPFRADKLHLHHRLLTTGLSQRQAVILLYFISAVFGIIAVVSGTEKKIQATAWLLAVMMSMAVILLILEWRKRRRENENV